MSDYQIFCCCTEGNRTVIKVYSLETFAHVMTLKGHANIIYWIGLSHDQKYLMSVGSDMTAKLWLIP
jgi:WD40 repeat protein